MADEGGAYEVESTIAGHNRDLFIVKRHGDKRRYIMALFELRPEDRDVVEADIARCVEIIHPAVVPVVDTFENDGDLVLVFEKVEGVTLQRVLEHLEKSDDPLHDAAVFHIAASLFGALQAAHTARNTDDRVVPLVHAELGPHQVFVSWTGQVQLLGVGLATIFRLAAASQHGSPAAAPFVAPEIRAGGALTVRANVYSAAALVWALLARQLPPTDGSVAPKLIDVRPDIDPDVLRALDEALTPSLLQRRITAGALERVFTPLAVEGAQKLEWGVDVLRAIETFDESLFGMESLPPKKLSQPAPEPMRPLITLAPSDNEGFATLPPNTGDGITFSVIPPSLDIPISFDDDDDDDDAPTLRPPPLKPPSGADS